MRAHLSDFKLVRDGHLTCMMSGRSSVSYSLNSIPFPPSSLPPRSLPAQKEAEPSAIRRAFRQLSLVHHPDKGGNPKIFQALNKAYQVVGDEEQRTLYNTCLGNQTFYVEKYGHYYLQQYYPKSNTLAVILFLLFVFSIMGPVIQQNNYKYACEMLASAAIRNKGLHEGGSRETMEIRRRALEQVKAKKMANSSSKAGEEGGGGGGGAGIPTPSGKVGKRKNKGAQGGSGGNSSSSSSSSSGGGGGKEEDPEFVAAVKAIVSEMDIQGNYRKWEWGDVLAVKLARLPLFVLQGGLFQVKWWFNHTYRGLPLSTAEEAYMACRMVGKGRWEGLQEEEKEELVEGKVWEVKGWSFADWMEEKEIKKMPPNVRKNYLRHKRRVMADGPGDLVKD